MQIARALQGGQHLLAHPGGLGQDGLGRVGRGLGKAVGRRDLAKADDMIEEKAVILDRGAIGHLELSFACLQLRLGMPAARV